MFDLKKNTNKEMRRKILGSLELKFSLL
jgi:hypothetical protein